MARKRKGEGQTALVTGASGGIGLELARRFAKDGYNLVLVARSAQALEAAAGTLSQQFRVTVVPIVCDLGRVGAGAALAKILDERRISVDVLVNNAGYGAAAAFAQSDTDDQLGMIDLNVRTLVELTHIYWPAMLKNGRGGVLNVVIGTLLIGTMLNGMTIMDVSYSGQNLIKGVVLLVAVIADSFLNPRNEETAQQGDI